MANDNVVTLVGNLTRVSPALDTIVGTSSERFWTKVQIGQPEECWPWKGSTYKRGYGQFAVTRFDKRPAHAIACELVNCPAPEGTECCHSCDNPPCCNPSHLRWGTRQENVDDCVRQGRQARGERNGHALLSEKDVLTIRHEYAADVTVVDLAARFGVTTDAIGSIVRGDRWRHIDGPTVRQSRSGRRQKFSDEQYAEIKSLDDAGLGYAEIAKRTGIDRGSIYYILRRRKTNV